MSVGLYDADMSSYVLVPPNLEIMKLSAYYKKMGEIVVLAPSFTPTRNTKFIYRKDYNDGEFPKGLLTTPNVEYGGLAFTKNVYEPLPLEIERCYPDTHIYSKMQNTVVAPGGNQALRKKVFNNMINSEHCRLSLDGKTIWEDYPSQLRYIGDARNLMIHDYDLGKVKGGYEEVKKIMARARKDGWATKLGMKFPVQISDGQSLINWSSFNSNSTFFSLRYNGVIDNDAFEDWLALCCRRAVYSQMEYHVTDARYDPNQFVETMLPKILRQIIISRSYRVFFSLIYDEGFFPDPRWEKVLQLFNYYHNSYAGETEAAYYNMITDDTLFDFASNTTEVPQGYFGEVFTKQQVREIFAFVREAHYPLFKDFYECSARTLGGKL